MEFTLLFIKTYFLFIALASPLLLSLFVLITVLGQIAGLVEGWKPFRSFYWTMITALTIGYGDVSPSKPFAKILSIIIGLIGIILTGILVAIAIESANSAVEKVIVLV